ncbi:ERF family protein [Phyllobacterium sp. BT25]|uniref:ERF family protein n=1 Tax=Phyllobacterium pellucidum TaxID=2740464 RepID=A0A849VTF5_9HYPH|nr:ERF family protein [Phyllobacterium pellucidum]NTS31310.1 ERF family protein [Phyllobacterium pellucidum]
MSTERIIDTDAFVQIGQPANAVVAEVAKKINKPYEGAAAMSAPAVIDNQNVTSTTPIRGSMTPMDMLNHAVETGANIETLTKLMDLQDRWEKNQARKAFEAAMSAAKAEIPEIKKSRKVDFTSGKGRTNYQYEDLAGIMSAVAPVLSKHGLHVRYRTAAEPNMPISVTCIISHSMGHSEENTLTAGRDDSGNKNSIQAIGSTVTYLQRYTLKAVLGLAAAADDDGSTADQTTDEAKPITEAQASVIRELIEQGELETPTFCDHWKVEAVTDIPMDKFNEVVGSLRRRVAWLKQQKSESAA